MNAYLHTYALHITTLFIALGGASLQASEESSTMHRITTWLTEKSPSVGCALVGTLGFSLEGLPEKMQRNIYKTCGWYFLGVTKDGREVTQRERHSNAFDAINPAPHEYSNFARSNFLQSGKKWDDWADEILKKHKRKI
jgi:hypothetical protein